MEGNNNLTTASEEDAVNANILDNELYMLRLKRAYWNLSPHTRWVLKMRGSGMEWEEMHAIYEARQGRSLARNTLQSAYYRAKRRLNFLHPEILPELWDESSGEEEDDDDMLTSENNSNDTNDNAGHDGHETGDEDAPTMDDNVHDTSSQEDLARDSADSLTTDDIVNAVLDPELFREGDNAET